VAFGWATGAVEGVVGLALGLAAFAAAGTGAFFVMGYLISLYEHVNKNVERRRASTLSTFFLVVLGLSYAVSIWISFWDGYKLF
jgi:hypothetical protein